MASDLWVPVPILLYSSKTGEKFILPSPSDLEFMKERLKELDVTITDESDTKKKKSFENLRVQTEKNVVRLENQVLDLKTRPDTELFEFYIKVPTLGEFNEAEEMSKDWIDGEPRVNESKLSELVMSGHIRLGNNDLTVSDIKNLDMQIGRKLWEEMKRLMMPNSSRLPFLN